ncbi:hypothetical protein [Candidatus Enterococcus clewellii]|uniref:ABC transporter permease n=1 Tax=Candidatus Enterococcus clewellii TaxID=1834193 RepID=A0A242K6E6_9ENTE|nr:hypothetical protein [Enterococcus sp. 9E7_DIV0242]OTP15880.1 hypothetical protein A5888_002094 [Enterococcus sp. 9E7_DIV0242]
MRHLVLLKKEAVEAFRTYRLFIILTVFVLFGLASSVTAKLLPEIIQALGGTDGIEIRLPDPSVYDSWLQFFSNHSQMTLIIFLITFGNALGKEVTGGTLVLLVTKGINRNSAMFAKVIYQALLWVGGLLLSFAITYLYNLWLFPGETQNFSGLIFQLLQLGVFGILFLSIANLGQVLLPKAQGGLLLSFVLLILLFIVNIFPSLAKTNPLQLIEVSTEGLKNGGLFNGDQLPLFLSLGLSVIFLIIAAFRFKRVSIY